VTVTDETDYAASFVVVETSNSQAGARFALGQPGDEP
jgi:hypothetical protein